MMPPDFWRIAPCPHSCQMAADAAAEFYAADPRGISESNKKLTNNAATAASICKLNKSGSQKQRRGQPDGSLQDTLLASCSGSAAVLVVLPY